MGYRVDKHGKLRQTTPGQSNGQYSGEQLTEAIDILAESLFVCQDGRGTREDFEEFLIRYKYLYLLLEKQSRREATGKGGLVTIHQAFPKHDRIRPELRRRAITLARKGYSIEGIYESLNVGFSTTLIILGDAIRSGQITRNPEWGSKCNPPSERSREVYRLHLQGGLSYTEIGRIIGTNAGDVGVTVARGYVYGHIEPQTQENN